MDIDGTICGVDHVITQETRDVLNELHRRGIRTGLASGRPISAITSCYEEWGLEAPFDFYIGMNGAMLEDSETGFHYDIGLMDVDEAKEVLDHMSSLDLPASIYCDDDVNYLMGMNDLIRASVKRNAGNSRFAEISSLDDIRDRKIYRILFRVDADKLDGVVEYVKVHPFKNHSGFRTQIICYEVMKKGIDKGAALKKYCEEHGFSADEVYAFGDTSNDIEMLKYGHGVCLCDGTKDALEAAEYTTEYPCHDSGMARFIRKHILEEER